MKTNASRQPKVSAAIRAGAALCVFAWVAGAAMCNLERLCNCTSHDSARVGHTQFTHDHETVAVNKHGHSHDGGHHHDDAEVQEQAAASHHHEDGAAQSDHGCKGKKCGDEKRCCSTIQAFVVTPTSIVVAKPVSQPVLLISLRCVARDSALATLATESLRHAKPRDWVFTPEVCLGPALHSLAPPASV